MDEALEQLDEMAAEMGANEETRDLGTLLCSVAASVRAGLPPDQMARTLDSLTEVYVEMQKRIQRDRVMRWN